MTLDRNAIGNILVRGNNFLGDAVMTSPALLALRHTYPTATIDILARPHVAEYFSGLPWVSNVILHEPRGAHRGARGFMKLIGQVRRRRYDMAVLLQKAFGAALIARMAGIGTRVGFDTDRRRWLLTHPIAETPQLRRIHHVEYFLKVARGAGCEIADIPRRLWFPIKESSRTEAAALLAAEDAGRFPFLAAFAPGASKGPRAWHIERFAQVARVLSQQHGAGIVVLGGQGDREAAEAILQAVGSHGIDACGRTNLWLMGALIERCRLFVGNDSGPMHVAAALDVPVVGLFGPGLPDKTAPWMAPDRYIAISNRFPCAPCRQDFFRECEPSGALKPMCLESIAATQVTAAVNSLLQRAAA